MTSHSLVTAPATGRRGERKLFLLAALALIGVGVAACAGPVETVSASSDATMMRYSAGSESDAARKANDNCNQYGKKARWRSNHPDASPQTTAIYDCVPL